VEHGIVKFHGGLKKAATRGTHGLSSNIEGRGRRYSRERVKHAGKGLLASYKKMDARGIGRAKCLGSEQTRRVE